MPISPAEPVPLFIPVGPELIIIVTLLILLFGAQRIPKLANAVGQSLSEFKRGRQESTDDTTAEPPTDTDSMDSSHEAEAAEPKR